MGERKGVNKYYPPDWTPAKGSLNKYHGTHALRERARKLGQGILIIRFEMPYNIWCDGCGNHIGMGVRYNAEKKKVGMYYTTPIYQFRMKCHLCDNHFEMKTDPQNLDYIIVSGARRQERRWDPSQNSQVVPEDKETGQKLATDAMFKLEHGVDDHKKSTSVAPSLAKLEDLQTRWQDDYVANKTLRQRFRTKKKEIIKQAEVDKQLLIKSSLNISLLPEDPQDAKVAGLLKLAPLESFDEKQRLLREEIQNREIFDKAKPLSKPQSLLKPGPSSDTMRKLVKNSQNLKMQVKLQGLSASDFGIVHRPVKSETMPIIAKDISDTIVKDRNHSTIGLVSYSDDTSDSDH